MGILLFGGGFWDFRASGEFDAPKMKKFKLQITDNAEFIPTKSVRAVFPQSI